MPIKHAEHSSLGATHTVDYHDAHAYDRAVMKEVTGGDGVDLIVDCYGDPALHAVRSVHDGVDCQFVFTVSVDRSH